MSRNEPWRGDRHGGRDRNRPPSPRRDASPPGAYDRWRPGDRRHGADAHRHGHRGPCDVYRPPLPQSDFTFRVDAPLHFPPPRFPPHGHGRGPPRKPAGRPRWQPPPHPSERALVSAETFRLPGQRLFDVSVGAKFRNVDELSDDEVDMDMSSDDADKPAAKRQRTLAAIDDAAPKWSNPDPYTTLPCPDEATRKKRDMVKLIRKARVDDVKPNTNAPPNAENFIAIGSSSDDDEDHGKPARPASLPSDVAKSGQTDGRDTSGPLGSRKRTHDDQIKPPDYGQLKKVSTRHATRTLLPEWQPKRGEDACPWATAGFSASGDMTDRLHAEVVAFYDFVRPQDFEQRIRTDLVENLKRAMKRDGRTFAQAHLYPFGSFMSGLYLPTADMDLVVCSPSFVNGGPPTFLGAKSFLYKFQRFLVTQRIADASSVTVIAHARVPLVKYVDRVTGLRVDVSFENMSGVKAIETFVQWKREYPAMPALVTVVKHFLLMRGLNEPVSGGIGGFSVICLVVSLLQTMPRIQGGGFNDAQHLGSLLLDFFELYGCQFRPRVNAISVKGVVGYVRKSDVSTFTYKDPNRLSIIDPHNPANDIAGGSSNTETILDRFEDAFYDLRDRMRCIQRHPDRGGILDVILKGDYLSFRTQRDHLKRVHEQTVGPCSG